MPRSSPGASHERRERRIAYSQNFLHSRKLVQRLVAQAEIGPNDLVIEIGPGGGIITEALAARCRHLLAIEKDPVHVGVMQEKCRNLPNVTVFAADILDFPLPGTPYKVFANIPFQITAAIVAKLTSGIAPPADAWLVMREAAATRYVEATLQSVTLAPRFAVEIAYRFRRQDFTPVPRVESALLHLHQRPEPLVATEDRECYESLVAALFSAWKPTVESALVTVLPAREVQRIRRDLHDAIATRPAALPPEGWIALFHKVKALDDPRVWQRCRDAVERLRAQQSGLPRRTRTTAGRL